MHNELTDIISTHTFVGIVDEQKRIAAIQGGVKLFLVDYGMLCNEYFYQVGLTDFGNFGSIRFNPPLPLQGLLEAAAEQEKRKAGDAADEVDWEEVVSSVKEQLIERADMLNEYFSMEVSEEGELLALPLLMKGYTPSMAKLPQFLLRLGPHVEWMDEKRCFQSFLKELASFYVPECLPLAPDPVSTTPAGQNDTEEQDVDMDNDEDEEHIDASRKSREEGKGKAAQLSEDPAIASRRKQLRRALEYVIFPAFKARLVATKELLRGVMEIANLKGLYRVFERC